MLEPMAVAVHAMRRLNPNPEETVAVCGLGTIGLLLVMFLLEAGVGNILAVGNKRSQARALVKLGLPEDRLCLSGDAGRWLEDRTGGRGADAFFECVGKNETVSLAVDAAAPGGRVCLVGNPASGMSLEKGTYWKILRNQLTVSGTWNSGFTGGEEDDWHYVLERLAAGRVHPAELVTHRFPLEQLRCGLEIMRQKKQDYIKILGTKMG